MYSQINYLLIFSTKNHCIFAGKSNRQPVFPNQGASEIKFDFEKMQGNVEVH